MRVGARARGPVLELGCGTGRLTLPLAKAGIDLTGLDRSTRMLACARQKLTRAISRRRQLSRTPHFVRGDIRDLPFRTQCFSMVLAPYGVLQSLLDDGDLAVVLESVHRVMAPGGTFGM